MDMFELALISGEDVSSHLKELVFLVVVDITLCFALPKRDLADLVFFNLELPVLVDMVSALFASHTFIVSLLGSCYFVW